MMELRKEDLSAMESTDLSQREKCKEKNAREDAPLLDLYSMMVVGGRCNTTRILSLLHAPITHQTSAHGGRSNLRTHLIRSRSLGSSIRFQTLRMSSL